MRIPYKEIAFYALREWNGLSEEEANKKVNLFTWKELETEVYAKSSIDHAIDSIIANFHLTEEDKIALSKAVYEGPVDAPIFSKIGALFKDLRDEETMVLGFLTDIHNGWVIDNSSEKTFNKKKDSKKLRQYVPLPLLGYSEAMKDFIFLKPILDACGVDVNNLQLEGAYYLRMHDFLNAHRIYSLNDLEARIATGHEFYPSLPKELADRLIPYAHDVAEQIHDNWYANDKYSATTFLMVQREEVERRKAANKGITM